MSIRIGISGWVYPRWRGTFYPKDLPHRRELEFASRAFRSIEINGTHYSLQSPKSFRKWHDETPDDFVFSVKGTRFITHIRRLRDVEKPLANFFASGVLALEKKLGPFLWQLPPSFRFDAGRIDHFLSLLPRTTTSAARLARRHDSHLRHRAWCRPGPNRRLRHCLEVRHGSFMTPGFFQILRRHRVAFVFADTAGKWPYAEDLTGDFVYIRLHGDKKLYVSGYTPRALKRWAERIGQWAKGGQPRDARLISSLKPRPRKSRDVFVYFDNDAKVKAPPNARDLSKLPGLHTATGKNADDR